jgi:hypothetical protein
MVIAEEDYNNFEASTLGTVSSEYQVQQNTPGLTPIHSETSTNWDDNKITWPEYVTRCFFPVTSSSIW